jgi:hypothetical protein
MKKNIRFLLSLILLLSFSLLAKSPAAWAANSSTQTSQSSSAQTVSDKKDSCDKDKDKDKDRDKDRKKKKSKDKDKFKDKNCKDRHHHDKDDDDKDDDDHGGTVRPPSGDAKICKKGDYSVGGSAVIQIKKLDEDKRDRDRDRKHSRDRDRKKEREKEREKDCIRAVSKKPTLSQLPNGGGSVLGNAIVLQSVDESKLKLCFAAPPGKKVKIYVYSHGAWRALETSVKNGSACAEAPRSGTYVLAGK